jgi:hypothetical protein
MLTAITLGVLAASAAQAALWAPMPLLWVIVVVLLGALAITFGACRLNFGDSVTVLLAQLICVVVLSVGSVIFSSGGRFTKEIPTILSYSKAYGAVGGKTFPGLLSPSVRHFEWRSSGSSWLDSRSARAVFEFRTQPVSPPVRVELRDAKGIIEFKQLDTSPVAMAVEAKVGTPYSLVFQGDSTAGIEVNVRGLLEPVLLD